MLGFCLILFSETFISPIFPYILLTIFTEFWAKFCWFSQSVARAFMAIYVKFFWREFTFSEIGLSDPGGEAGTDEAEPTILV